ncbi:hypothetical protein I4U23_003122 [Adineta vaga]|nr:hypothetical protein I4U23_003122 [Adineta vaga]
MFWECHVVTSSIDKLLDLPVDERKLQDFLNESDLIQECLNQNKLLLDYLVQGNIMQELIHHIITIPSDADYRNANVVSELLSGDFQRVQDALLEKENLDLLYSFLLSKDNETLNPILASYFVRIINTLIIRKPNEILIYFKSRDTFKEDFLRHLDSTSMTDMLYHFISDSAEQRSDAIKWYEDINLIDGLIEQFLLTESKSIQINITSLLSELLRLAFDQQVGLDFDTTGPSLSATIERLLYGRMENSQGTLSARHYSSSSDDEKKSTNADTEEKLTPVVLAEHIVSKFNLERIFDALIKRPILVAVGCEFLESILDLLNRQMPVPICISLTSIKDEPMQINDEGDTPPVNKSTENETAFLNLTKDPLVRIYLNLIEVIPSHLPSLITLLSSPTQPLISTSNENSQTIKYQFIHDPLGSTRLNLIKFFSKLISTISNDYAGDHIYEILNSSRLLQILIDLFLRHIYNNFLHTQVYFIIRSIIHNNSIVVKQPNDLWTRTRLENQEEFSESSAFHYKSRCLHKLFQSLLNPTEVNLFEYLFDQYEKTKLDNSSTEKIRFKSPNSGHIAQILRYLRDHALTFDNYSSFFQHTDENTNALQTRWQTILDHLNEDEKKWSAMHITERTTSSFRSTTSSFLTHMGSATDNTEASLRRQTFHKKSFGTKPYVDDDDEEDDEVERFDIDDELMKNDQTANEKKVAEMKKISFEPDFPSKFNEDTLWYQEINDNLSSKTTSNDHDDQPKTNTPPILPDLFENHRKQQEKNATSATESNFEQLCSLQTNEINNDFGLFPIRSSSTLRDEAISKNDLLWKNQPIYLANSNEKQPSTNSNSSSSDEDNDDDGDELKNDFNIPDDENYFVHNDTNTNEVMQVNNMMDIFRRQSSSSSDTTENNSTTHQQPISSSTPEHPTSNSDSSGNASHRMLDFTEQENGLMNSDDDLELQDNFSFLIAKGMLKPSSTSS